MTRFSLRLPVRLSHDRGFTLIELIVAMSIFIMVVSVSVVAFAQIIKSQAIISQRQSLQEESRFALEKIVKEFRNGTIDYAQYHTEHWGITYSEYRLLPENDDHPNSINDGTFSPGENREPVLTILNPDGTLQTKITKQGTAIALQHLTICLDSNGELQWEARANSDYYGGVGTPLFLELSPDTLSVNGLDFFIFPMKDPNKVFEDDAVQYQPTILIRLAAATPDDAHTLDLQTTVTSRIYSETLWDETVTTACET